MIVDVISSAARPSSGACNGVSPAFVIVKRETSPAIALQLIRDRECWAGPILGDSGMNVEIENHQNGMYHQNQADDTGAILRFKWDGVVVLGANAPKINNMVMQADLLIDEFPHRAIFPVGTGQGLTASTATLRLISVYFDSETDWSQLVDDRPKFKFSKVLSLNMWLQWFLGLNKKRWVESETKKIKSEINSILKTTPQIMVVLPPFAPYSSLVKAVYPKCKQALPPRAW